MGKISTYTTTTPELNDKLIGSEANSTPSDATKNFTIGDIVALTPDNTLSEVLTAGNTATNDITLSGNIVCTSIIPTNINDAGGNTGTTGQYLAKSVTNVLEWKTETDNTLSEVLAAGNTATNDIALTGTIVASGNISSSLSIEGEDVISNTFLSANGEIPLKIINVDAYDDDAAAGLAGLTGGDVYQTTAANANGAGILMVKQ